MPATQDERGRFAGLLAAQALFIATVPLLGHGELGRVLLRIGLFAIVLAGIWAAGRERWGRLPSILLMLVVVQSWLGPNLFPAPVGDALRVGTVACSYAFTTFVVLRAVSRHETVTLNTLLGGINAYLLLALTFMFLHVGILGFDPNAYESHGRPILEGANADGDQFGVATLFYFSVSTLTTLGYGDIVPRSSIARLLTSVEAIVGQLYVAIFIGRLVGLAVDARRNPDRYPESER